MSVFNSEQMGVESELRARSFMDVTRASLMLDVINGNINDV